jgi:hypothetical protein
MLNAMTEPTAAVRTAAAAAAHRLLLLMAMGIWRPFVSGVEYAVGMTTGGQILGRLTNIRQYKT